MEISTRQNAGIPPIFRLKICKFMVPWRWAVFAASLYLTGCSQVVDGTRDGVRIETGWLGEIAPGARGWLSWMNANEHCAGHGRRPQLAGLRDGIAVYRCVVEK